VIDLRLLRDDPDRVRASQRVRGADESLVDALLAADDARRAAVSRADSLRGEQKTLSRSVAQASAEDRPAVLARAKGEAEQKISAAQGYAAKRINEAEGDAGRFNALLTEYKKAPEVTRKRIYLETMGELLTELPNKIILDDKAPQFLPMLQMQQKKLPQNPQPSATR